MLLFLLPLIFLSAPSARAQGSDRTGEGQPAPEARPSDQPEIMSAAELMCHIKKGANIPDRLAQETAENITNALKMIKFPPGKFTRISLLHFMAQVIKESSGGRFMTELRPRSRNNTGYGYIQVTGRANLRQAEQCINRIQPGLGVGIASNPEAKLGRHAPNKQLAALASLCWWDANIVKNDRHNRFALGNRETDAQRISEIVNTGRIGGRMTGGFRNAVERGKVFLRMLRGGRQCP